MNSEIKVLHILNHSYPYADGYAIRSFNIINGERHYGMNPVVLTSPKHEPEYKNNPEIIDGTHYYRIAPLNKKGIIPSNLYIICLIWRHIRKIYQKEKFDLIHAHSPALCGLGAMIFSIQTGIPFIYEVRAFWEDAAVDAGKYAVGSLKYRMTRFLESLVFLRANAVTTIANYLKDDISARRGKRSNVFLVPNGVDCTRFKKTPKDKELKEKFGLGEYPVIGFIGSFYRFEGLDVLLKSLAILKDLKIRYKAILVGSGEMDSEWRKLAEQLALSDVIFTGRVPHDDVLRYYSVMDILVYPRLKERITDLVTPLKPLEAMAMGKPVIGSDVGGIKEILGDGKGGLLFPAGNHEALSQLLKRIIDNPALYNEIASIGKRIAAEKYSWTAHIERYQKIYQTVLSS